MTFGRWIKANQQLSVVLALCACAAITGGVITRHYPTWLCVLTSAGAAALTFDACAVVMGAVDSWRAAIVQEAYRRVDHYYAITRGPEQEAAPNQSKEWKN